MTNPSPVIERFGNGKDVVLFLHGWGQSVTSLTSLAEILADRAQGKLTCLVTEFPGFGTTPIPDGVWGLNEYCEWVHSILVSEGIKSAAVVGHSFGGKVAVALSAKHKNLIKKLVLIGASGLRPRISFRKAIRNRFISLLRSLLKRVDSLFGTALFRTWFVPRFASRDYLQSGLMKDIFVKTVNQSVEGEASSVTAQTLLLWGERDEESPLSVGERFRSLMSNARLVVLPHRGHFPFEGAGAHLCALYIHQLLCGREEA